MAVGALVAAGGVATVAALGNGGDSGGGTATGLPPSTTKVTKQTLRDTLTEDGQLGYGPADTRRARRRARSPRSPRAATRSHGAMSCTR